MIAVLPRGAIVRCKRPIIAGPGPTAGPRVGLMAPGYAHVVINAKKTAGGPIPAPPTNSSSPPPPDIGLQSEPSRRPVSYDTPAAPHPTTSPRPHGPPPPHTTTPGCPNLLA